MTNLDLKNNHSEGDVFSAGITSDVDKLNGITTQIDNNTTHLEAVDTNQIITKLIAKDNAAAFISAAAASSTKWVFAFGNDSTNLATYNAGTWDFTVAHGLGEACLGVIACDAAPTNMLCWGATKVAFSTDSGDTWADADIDPPNCTTILSMHCPTTTLAVAVGDSSSLRAQWRNALPFAGSSNDWVQAGTGTTTKCVAVHMIDGNDGYMLCSDKTIWNTGIDAGDSAANVWTDTSDVNQAAAADNSQIYSVSTAATIIATDVALEVYADGNNAAYTWGHSMANHNSSNIVKATNGYYYCVIYPNSSITDANPITLCMSTDSGATWYPYIIGSIDNAYTAAQAQGFSLVEYDTNKLLCVVDRFVCTIDISNVLYT